MQIMLLLNRAFPVYYAQYRYGSPIHSGAKSAEIGTVIDQFYQYKRYSVTITLQIEKYSLSFAHIGPDAP